MKRRAIWWMLLAFAAFTQAQAWAATPERWEATSTTAMAITGNVTFSPDKITFANGKSLPLADGRRLSAFMGNGRRVDATAYRVTAPTDLQLVRGNRLCDGKPVTYLVVWNPPKIGGDIAPRSMAAFSGQDLPATEASPASCGTFNYDAGHVR